MPKKAKKRWPNPIYGFFYNEICQRLQDGVEDGEWTGKAARAARRLLKRKMLRNEFDGDLPRPLRQGIDMAAESAGIAAHDAAKEIQGAFNQRKTSS